MSTKAIIYARVSTKEQEETGYSLDAQEKLLKDYSEKKGFKIVKTFRISETASGRQVRKNFNDMLVRLHKDVVPILICEKTDRLTRNLKDAAAINDWLEENGGHELHFVKENLVLTKDSKANEKFMWDIKVAVARHYTNNLSEEVKKGQAEKISQGWLPNKSPYGYKSAGEQGHKIHVVDENIAPFIRKMFDHYSTGNYSLKSLSEKMFEEGFRSRAGKKAPKRTIEFILKDPFFYGAIPWNNEIYAGKHQPLVSKELFDKVQVILSGKTTPRHRGLEIKFRKMFTCEECGGTITGEIHKGHVYYHCNHYRSCSQKKFVREEVIEEQLIGVFRFFENITPAEAEEIKFKIKQNHAQEIDYKEAALKSVNERYNLFQRRLDALYDDKLDGKISSEFWERKSKEITDQQAELQEQISKLKTEEAKYFEIWLNILDLARRAREIYERRTPEERRLLLKHIFSNLMLKDEKVASTLNPAMKTISKRVQEKLDAEKTFEPKKSRVVKRRKDSFDTLHPALLALVDDFRTINWSQSYLYPSIELEQIRTLLTPTV